MKYFYGDYENHLIKTFTILITILVVLSMLKAKIVNAENISYGLTPTPDSVRISDATFTSLQNITSYTSMSTATLGTYKVYKQTSGNNSMYARIYFQNNQFSNVSSEDRIYKVTSTLYSTYPINNIEYELSNRRYSCKITNSYPNQWTTNGNVTQTTSGTIYSIECENVVQNGSNGYYTIQFDKLNNPNGYINIGIGNITYVWTNYTSNSEIINNDQASQDSKTNVDDTSYQNAHAKEQALLNSASYDANTINITYDRNAAIWVWNTITRYLNANQYIMGLMLTILSIGVIKMVLNR